MVSRSKLSMSLLRHFLYEVKSDEDLPRLLEQNPELHEFHSVVIPMQEALFMLLDTLSLLSQQHSDIERIEEIQESPQGISFVFTREAGGQECSIFSRSRPLHEESDGLKNFSHALRKGVKVNAVNYKN